LNKPVIYISGLISNNPDYKLQFTKAYRKLEDSGKYCVLSPLMINAPDLEYESFITIDLAMLSVSNIIYMLKGWDTSAGANRELQYAKEKGLEIIFEE